MNRTSPQTKETKKMDFPSVHLTMFEHSMLEEAWQELLKYEKEAGVNDMAQFITETVANVLDVSGSSPDLEVPQGIDLNTVAIFQAISLHMRCMGTVAEVEPKEFIAKVWKLSRLYYRELLRQSGIKPEGS